MKKIIPVFTSLLLAGYTYAQEPAKEKKEKTVEIIKIIDGDTVMHRVNKIEMDDRSDHHQVRRHMRNEQDFGSIDKELDSILESVDIYLNLDDVSKKMIVRRIDRHDGDMDEIIKELEDGEDLIIDMDRKERKTKVIRIDISEEDGKEVKTVEMDRTNHRKERNEDTHRVRRGHERMAHREGTVKVYPNPSAGELNIEFSVEENDPLTLTVQDETGKQIYNKEYKKAGQYKEVIDVGEGKKGLYIIHLNQKRRSEIRKIIVE